MKAQYIKIEDLAKQVKVYINKLDPETQTVSLFFAKDISMAAYITITEWLAEYLPNTSLKVDRIRSPEWHHRSHGRPKKYMIVFQNQNDFIMFKMRWI